MTGIEIGATAAADAGATAASSAAVASSVAAAGSGAALTAADSAFLASAGVAGSGAATAGAGSALTAAAQVASLIGTAISTVGAINQGTGARRLGKFQAAQLLQSAGQSRAIGQRAAYTQANQANLVKSRIRSLAGGNAGDPSVVDIMGDVQGQGEYNALTSLYNGNERAAGLDLQAAGADISGNQAEKSGYVTGVSTALKGVSMSLMNKYSPI